MKMKIREIFRDCEALATHPVLRTPRAKNPALSRVLRAIDSDLGEIDPFVSPFTNIIDQSGLFVPFVSGQTEFDVYFSDASAANTVSGFDDSWQSLADTAPPHTGYIDFDLGADHTIDRLAIWSVSLAETRILVAMDPAGPWDEIGQYTLQDRTFYTPSYEVEILDLGGYHLAGYLRIAVDSTHAFGGGVYSAVIGEVAISSSTPVPEPGVGFASSIGICSLALLAHRRPGLRRRRRAVA